MPEGDTIFQAAARLDAFFRDQVLTSSDFRVPRFATLQVTGETTLGVASRGKHLLHRLSNGLTIHSHLKMEGRWDIYEPGQRWKKPGYTARVILGTGGGTAVGFSLGLLEVIRTDQEADRLSHLGPDLLGPDWDPVEAQIRLEAHADKPIGLALLDQSIMAGIGNIFRNELCFLAGIHPKTLVSETNSEFLVSEAHRLLGLNRTRPRRRTTPDKAGPRNPYFVYGRHRATCLICRTPIRQDSLGDALTPERVIYFCPTCQPA